MKHSAIFALTLWLAFLQVLAPLLHVHVGAPCDGAAIHTHTLLAPARGCAAEPQAQSPRQGASAVIGMADEHRPGDTVLAADAAPAREGAPVPQAGLQPLPFPFALASGSESESCVLPWPQAPPSRS